MVYLEMNRRLSPEIAGDLAGIFRLGVTPISENAHSAGMYQRYHRNRKKSLVVAKSLWIDARAGKLMAVGAAAIPNGERLGRRPTHTVLKRNPE